VTEALDPKPLPMAKTNATKTTTKRNNTEATYKETTI